MDIRAATGDETLPEKPIEQRVGALEQQMQEIMEKLLKRAPQEHSQKDWRRSLGMFDASPLMREIDAEGERVRQADRERAANDHS